MKYLLIIWILCAVLPAGAQTDTVAADTPVHSQVMPTDTLPVSTIAVGTTGAAIDTVPTSISVAAKQYTGMDSLYQRLVNNPYLQMKEAPVYMVIEERVRENKDEMFYLLAGLLLFLAFIKAVFPRYFSNVFKLFFQPSFRQKQTREQLSQNTLPSFLLNLLAVVSGGAYIALLLDHFDVLKNSFWILFLYSSVFLLLLYTGKYFFLSFSGWVFNVKQAAETYIFIVYLINKIVGVLLIPFTMLIAFSKPPVMDVAITASLLTAGLLIVYRYFIAWSPVRREVKVSFLHFFFYILAFEIIPLLLIYKTLIIYLSNSL